MSLEITAAYREPKTKTYGFQHTGGLTLVEVSGPGDAPDLMGLGLCDLGELGIGFHLAFGRVWEGHPFRIYLLVSSDLEPILKGQAPRLEEKYGGLCIRVLGPAELVFFQGPHFGDRSGILDTTLRALAPKSLRVIASACSLSCVYLVVPQGTCGAVVEALSKVFEIPRPPRALTARARPGYQET